MKNDQNIALNQRNWKISNSVLTISAHSCSHALLEPAVLTSVPVDPLDVTLLILGAWSVVDLLLDGPTEESLKLNDCISCIGLTKNSCGF